MQRVEDDAICVRVWEWSETSQTVCLLTRGHGLVRGLAKGSRRPKAAFSGGFEPITKGQVGFITKPGRELAILTHWDLGWVLPEARRSLAVFYGGLYAADLAGRLIQDHDPHPGVYEALERCLESLPAGVDRAVMAFQWAALVDTGHRPDLWNDVRTGEVLADSDTLGFDPHLGGVVPDPGVSRTAWRVRSDTIEMLRRVSNGEGTGARPDKPETVNRSARLLNAYAEYLIGRTLASAAALWGRGWGASTGVGGGD